VSHYAIYVRRSYKRADAADVSDATQLAAARALLPRDATFEVISDSGGHRSGYTSDRAGYQLLISKVRDGSVQGIAVYDLSRLARNARLMLSLRDELERHNVTLLIAMMPQTTFDSAIGRFVFLQLCGAAQLQRDLDSERMTTMMRSLFLDGRHRGSDPLGYRSARDERGVLLRPRQLEVVPGEAEVVRRVWRMAATMSTAEIALTLNREGISRRPRKARRPDGTFQEVQEPWTRDAVKDILRRGRFYLGFVVEKRGLEERPGHHEPIIDDLTYNAGLVGSRGRSHPGTRPKPHRLYLLRRVLSCENGHAMHGACRVSRGHEWRYYVCRKCSAPSVPAQEAEAAVIEAIRTMVLPSKAIDEARRELARRLDVPDADLVGSKRSRLESRLARLTKLFSWSEISDEEYRTQMAETRAMLAELPDPDKLVAFDRNRKVMVTMAENVERANKPQLADLVQLLVESVKATGRVVEPESIVWTPPARPFFQPSALLWRPRTEPTTPGQRRPGSS
jgi:DNA invertase Pin-like site-specific DNA recombinase